ncbi:MAG: ribosomal subunit interface protein [Candidatus Staskawiczbacteria bacterium RIFCSPHIGHO2_02_FULL_42_22]|uniref:Ribosomal subunit interface protein n=1 Tax=Candidatus Staskawiczbacteria bacterium RIFCSPHIGHO2_02_FULL_42_22 TaxID=1802207 RepID=A0A1G2I4V9_9BACT|nr:MAG: ribosomal subunit interface protein [Candidatus Staskawiczbacteria bacterium RIFCSPHIGHO2_02_FULL_42_22]
MNIIIKTKNIELTDSLEKFIQQKIGKLEKFSKILGKDSLEMFVEIEKETNHHRKGEIFFAEAILVMPGKKLVARAKSDDLGKAVSEVKEELEIEIKKYKLKAIELPRRQAKKSRKEIF